MPRITGKLGSISLTGHASAGSIADLFNWTLEFSVRADPCGIKGQIAEQYSYGEFTGRITAERFATDTEANSVFADALLEAAATAGRAETAANGGGGRYVTYLLEQIDGADLGNKVTGTAMVVAGGLNAPRAMATDRFELLLTSLPVIDVSSP